jgi:hypothetical protein
MKKRGLFVGMLAMALVLGLSFIGCKQPTDTDEDEKNYATANVYISELV